MKHTIKLHTPNYLSLLASFNVMIIASGYRQTGRTYQNNVKEFLSFLEIHGILSVKMIRAVDMVQYYEHLSDRNSLRGSGLLKKSTISGKMRAIDMFFNYLLDSKKLSKKITLPRYHFSESSDRNIATVKEVLMIYNVCESKLDTAILSLAYGCGLRRSELHKLDIKDLLLKQNILIVRSGKNKKRREIPLTDSIVGDLKNYLYEERHSNLNKTYGFTDAFLINRKGERMAGAHINFRLKELIEKVNDPHLTAKNITLHCLRHSIATHLLESGASFGFVRDFLGHSEIDTVQVYVKRRRLRERSILNH